MEGFRIRLTPWDERAFGFRCAEVTALYAESPNEVRDAIAGIEAWAHHQGVVYLFGRFPAQRAVRSELALAGFALVETSLTLAANRLDRLPKVPASMRVMLADADESTLEEAARILRTEFQHGRFLEDPWVPESSARLRNDNWLRDLYRAGEVQIASIKGQPVGFHVARVNAAARTGDLVLTGVGHEVPGAALPTWVAALEQLQALDVHSASTMVSAANVGVLNLYSSLGFRVVQAHLGYRKVLRDAPRAACRE